MEPAQLELPAREDVSQAVRRGARGDVEAELRVRGAGLQVRVRVRGDTGTDAKEHRLAYAAVTGERREPVDLLAVVDHDAADTRRESERELVGGLVVPVEVDAIHREAHDPRRVQLAAGDDVEAETLVRDDAEDPRRAVRLRRVADGHPAGIDPRERLAVLTCARANARFVVDVERRAVLRGERDEVASADREVTVGPDARGVGEDVGVRGGRAHPAHDAARRVTPIRAVRVRRPDGG